MSKKGAIVLGSRQLRQRQICFYVLFLCSTPAWAQELTSLEASVGYTYNRINPTFESSSNCNGGYVSFNRYFNNWFGLGGTVNACGGGGSAPSSGSTAVRYLAGPTFAYRRSCHVVPFAHVLVGGTYATSTFVSFPVRNQPVFDTSAANGFALAAGGGLDVPFGTSPFAFRVAEVDYLLTRLNGSSQSNVQVQAGIVLHWH